MVVYSTFERQLNLVCELVRRRSQLPIGYTDLYGQGIARAANYLQKVAGVLTPFRTAAWTKAQQLGRIRNAIAHGGGQVNKDDQQTVAAAEQLKMLSRDAFDEQTFVEIDISPEFVASAIALLREVLHDIANYELYKPKC